ncbi:APC family permease [Leifsonia flava]|uniref:APC family permease n=1 Tax=Orlajensenia leifsoniae TaxID=2561933 RepID=UPI001F030D45|nr:amino acid permease [Leifsonia flava]
MTSTATRTVENGPSGEPTVHQGSLGLARGTALYIAAVLGTGILVLPGLAASVAGPASIIAVAAVFLLSIPLAGTFAALASRYPDPGGVASYARRALGDVWARMAGYWFYFGVCVGAPVVGVLGAEYVVAVLGVDHAAVAWVGIAIFVPPFVINFFGVRVSGALQLVLTALLLVVVVGVVAVSSPQSDAANFQPFLPHGIAGIGTAISLFLWAFAGWEVGTHIAGEFRNPRRVIPIATAIAVVVVGAAYLALQVVTVAVLGDAAGTSATPLVDLVADGAPGYGPFLVAVIAAVVVAGVVNAYLGAFSKLGASLGRDGDLPRWLARGVEDGEVPRRSLSVVALLISVYYALMAASGFELTPFILVHTSSMAAIYAIGMIAAMRLLATWSLGWWMAVVSTVLTAGLLALAGPNLIIPAVLAVAAVIVGLIKRRTKRE